MEIISSLFLAIPPAATITAAANLYFIRRSSCKRSYLNWMM